MMGVAITKVFKREEIYDLLMLINNKAEAYSIKNYGLPVGNAPEMEEYADLIISILGLTVMEDERILTIQKHTGCTRAQAQSLIDSGDI